EDGFAGGVGFVGIAVAVLARNHPLAIVPAALLFGTLSQGGLAVNFLVPKEIVDVLMAVVILAVAIASARGRGRRGGGSCSRGCGVRCPTRSQRLAARYPSGRGSSILRSRGRYLWARLAPRWGLTTRTARSAASAAVSLRAWRCSFCTAWQPFACMPIR